MLGIILDGGSETCDVDIDRPVERLVRLALS